MPHYVHPKISDWGVKLEFSCTEEPGAKCKITCPPDPRGPYYSCEVFRAEHAAELAFAALHEEDK